MDASRRKVLAGVAGTALVGGWLGRHRDDPRRSGPSGRAARAKYGDVRLDYPYDRPVQTATIRNRESIPDPEFSGSLTLSVWNDGPDRTVEVTITGERVGRVLDEGFALPAGRHVEVDFEQADAYTVEIHAPDAGGSWYWFPIRELSFDCNSTSTIAAVRPGGRVELGGSSTLILCESFGQRGESPGPE